MHFNPWVQASRCSSSSRWREVLYARSFRVVCRFASWAQRSPALPLPHQWMIAVMLPHVSSAAGLPAPGVWPHHHPQELAVGSLQPALYAVREGWWGRGTCQAVSHAEEEVLESLSSTALAWPYLHMLSSAKWLLCCSGSERGTLLNQAHSLLPRCKTDTHLDLGSLWHTCWVCLLPSLCWEMPPKARLLGWVYLGSGTPFRKASGHGLRIGRQRIHHCVGALLFHLKLFI